MNVSKKSLIVFSSVLMSATLLAFFSQQRWGLRGEYYANPNWQGPPTLAKRDARPYLKGDLGYKLLATNVFSVKWRGWLAIPETGAYKFATNSDDGSMLWLNEQEVVNNGGVHGLQKASQEIQLAQGVYPIEIRYLQAGGFSYMQAFWTPPGASEQPLPAEMLFVHKPAGAEVLLRKGFMALYGIGAMSWRGLGIVMLLALFIWGGKFLRLHRMLLRPYQKLKANTLGVNLLLFTLSTLLTLCAVELALRFYKQYGSFGAGTELMWMRTNPQDLTKTYTIDPDFGFRPILGTDHYNRYGTVIGGTVPNNYPLPGGEGEGFSLTKRPGVSRLLFIGDSVTERGRIILALKNIYGDEKFEYWNAGVESFNTVQEVNFYKKYNAPLRPDHVILTFSLNDFETTPVAFLNREGKLVVYVPNHPLTNINRWFFKNSYVYRLIIGLLLDDRRSREAIAEEVRASLQELQDLLKRNGIALTVLVLPLFEPYETWMPHEKEARQHILQILTAAQIRSFDLFEPFDQAIKAGINTQEQPGDTWHPSAAMAGLFAKYLFEQQLL